MTLRTGSFVGIAGTFAAASFDLLARAQDAPEAHKPRAVVARRLGIAMLLLAAGSASAHEFKCSERSGIDRARCERHEKMFAKCGPIKGEAHFVCDREFLLAHPLDCKALSGDDVKRCEAELAAFKVCEPKPGREFMRCVRDEAKASPMGSH